MELCQALFRIRWKVDTVPRATPAGSHWVDENQAATSLIRRCRAGDTVAWAELVHLYNRRVYNICYRFCGSASDAQDLTQDVFLKLYRSLESYDDSRGSFMTWLAAMTRNLLVDHFRRTRQQRLTDSLDSSASDEEDAPRPAEQLADARPSPDAVVQSRQTQLMVQRALEKLSPDLREAVILRDLQDMDYREIAQALRLPEGTVKSRINRGRTELARLLSRTYKQVM
jgi:RNA polymerase sigma-70 factor (ECF subfamily)